VRFREPRPRPEPVSRGALPLVYISFGSVAPQLDFFPGLYLEAVEQLAPLPVRVLLTTGGAHDPAELGALPANVRAERWVDEHAVLPGAAAMVSHGGAGSVRTAVSHGVPLAVVPLFAEQPQNARAVARAGAGLALDGASGLAEAVQVLLEKPEHRRAARAIAAEVAALPAVDEASAALEGYLSLKARMRSSYWAASRA
jgi:MGT family glycosyltransferase